MSQVFTTDTLQRALSFPFRDPEWKNKLLTGSAIFFAGYIVPIVPWLMAYGYALRMMRGIIVDRREPHLPEWDNWGEMLVDGLKLGLLYLIYNAPFAVLMIAGYGIMFLPMLWLGPDGTYDSGGTFALLPLATGLGGMALMGLAMALALVTGVALLPAASHLAATGRLGAALRVRQWWPIFRANLGGFLMSYLVVMGVSMLLSFALQFLYLTIILCCLIPFLMAPVAIYLTAISYSLYAEAYRAGADKLAAVRPTAAV